MRTGLSDILNRKDQSAPILVAVMYMFTKLQTVAVTDNNIHSLTLHYTVTVVTPLTFLLWLC
jgi:hypothetical protein